MLALCRCGEATYIVVTVAGDFEIPGEVDTLRLEVVAEQGGEVLLRTLARLDPDLAFPVEVGFEPSSDTPAQLAVTVTALHQGTEVASAGGEASWTTGATSRLTLQLEP